jgi:hypothetical protein
MSKDKVMEQALKSLGRIKERTQLSYAWFAASFLLKAFKNMFSGFYIDAFNLEKVKHHKVDWHPYS